VNSRARRYAPTSAVARPESISPAGSTHQSLTVTATSNRSASIPANKNRSLADASPSNSTYRGTDRREQDRRQIERAGGAPGIRARMQAARGTLRRGTAPPRAPPRATTSAPVVLELSVVTSSGKMHVGKDGTDLLAVARLWRAHRAPGRPGDETGGLAVQGSEVPVAAVGDRRGARYAVTRKVRHEVSDRRKLRCAEPLEKREHEAAVQSGDEVIRVFDPCSDARRSTQRADGRSVSTRPKVPRR